MWSRLFQNASVGFSHLPFSAINGCPSPSQLIQIRVLFIPLSARFFISCSQNTLSYSPPKSFHLSHGVFAPFKYISVPLQTNAFPSIEMCAFLLCASDFFVCSEQELIERRAIIYTIGKSFCFM